MNCGRSPLTDRYPHTTSNTDTLPMTTDGHYDSRYGSPYTYAAQHQLLRQPIASSYRSASSHQPVHHWQQSPELVEPYVSACASVLLCTVLRRFSITITPLFSIRRQTNHTTGTNEIAQPFICRHTHLSTSEI